MQKGLILEGGGTRGIYTAGVLDAFLENNIVFDAVIGVSAGAIHGASYVSKQKGRSIRYFLKYGKDPRFMSFSSLLKTGDYVGSDFCYHEIPEKLDVYDFEEFKRTETKFYVTCTNVESGNAEYILMEDMKADVEYLRASASLPYVSRLVDIKGKKYLDGGCSDSVPVKAFEKMGYGRNVIILTRDPEYRKKSESGKMADICYRRFPKFIERLKERHVAYNDTISYINEKREKGEVFVIQPQEPLAIGRLDKSPEKAQMIYDQGYKDGMENIEQVRKFLEV